MSSEASGTRARERSAGGVVVRGAQVVVIVPTRRAADGSRVLALPKGHVDPGESPVEAAAREVREETGVVAEPVCELGESRYWYRRNGRTIGKTVVFFLFSYLDGSTDDHDHEVEEARWIDAADARLRLTYPAEREMVERALAHIARKDR
jgi:8-oxo-dGTP pyrophosphatase MutT (NUDIX family)